MRVLIYEPVNQVQYLLVNILIQNGFSVTVADAPKEIIPSLEKEHYTLFITECYLTKSNTDREMIEILRSIRMSGELSTTNILIHTLAPMRIYIEDLLRIGIKGLILKPFVPEKFMMNLMAFVQKHQLDKLERRQFARFNPHERDNVRMLVRNPETRKLISCKITDISMGGAAFKIFGGEANAAELLVGQLLQNVQIILRTQNIITSAILVARRGDSAACKFINMDMVNRNQLSQYIYELSVNNSKQIQAAAAVGVAGAPLGAEKAVSTVLPESDDSTTDAQAEAALAASSELVSELADGGVIEDFHEPADEPSEFGGGPAD